MLGRSEKPKIEGSPGDRGYGVCGIDDQGRGEERCFDEPGRLMIGQDPPWRPVPMFVSGPYI